MTKQIRFVDGALEKYKLTTPIEPIVAIVLNIFLNDIQLFQRPCGTSAQIQLLPPNVENGLQQLYSVNNAKCQPFRDIHFLSTSIKRITALQKTGHTLGILFLKKSFPLIRSLFAPEHP